MANSKKFIFGQKILSSRTNKKQFLREKKKPRPVSRGRFIFASEKRAKTLWLYAKVFAVICVILIALLANNFITSPSGRKFPENEKTIIDQISTRDTQNIFVEGTGPVLTLQNE